MNRKITNRFFAGLCISIGLMACTQNLEQERYSDLIVGLEGDEIILYPLGDRLTLPVISVSEWQIINKPEWLGCTKTDNAIELSVGLNEVDDNVGEIIIQSSDGNEKYIQVSQDTLCFNLIDKNGDRLENNEKVGNELEVEVEHNVFYGFDSDEFKVATLENDRYHISAALEGAFNTDEAAIKDFDFFLYDKDKTKSLKSFSVTFQQDVFYFYFDKNNYVMSKSEEVEFEGDSYTYSFVASEMPEYDTPKFTTVAMENNGDNKYKMTITVKRNTDTKERSDTLKFYTSTYGKDDAHTLKVAIKQKGQPDVQLIVGDKQGDYELLDSESVRFELKVDGETYSGDRKLECSNPDIIEIKDNNTIIPKSIGETTIVAKVTVNDVELESNTVIIKVVREYSTGSGEEIGDDTGDEW